MRVDLQYVRLHVDEGVRPLCLRAQARRHVPQSGHAKGAGCKEKLADTIKWIHCSIKPTVDTGTVDTRVLSVVLVELRLLLVLRRGLVYTGQRRRAAGGG